MKNVTITLPEDVLERLRSQAQERGVSLNRWLRDLLTQESTGGYPSAAHRFAQTVREAGPAPKTWKWNREELYEE